MDNGFPILMLIFAGALLLYAALMAVKKDYNMLPYRATQSLFAHGEQVSGWASLYRCALDTFPLTCQMLRDSSADP